ncbi:MAG: sensor histidine kinase [Clostridiales bacterium]|nr:sensor histidine kinase [Clostridiales bacterium]
MLKDYLRSRIKVIILLLIVEGLFASSYFLFNMPAVTVLYPLFLSFAVILAAGVIDYIAVLRKHGRLIRNDIPEVASPIEKDYQTIIDKLKEEEEFSRKKASEDYNNMVEYYTVWAHQIKTPIASMRLQIQSEDSDLSRRLDSDLNRIEAYVEMVLTFLRLDSDSTDYVIREISLDDVIRPVIRKFARDFITKKLTMDYEPADIKVLSDEKWLSFVIEQVLSNAVKYTNNGGIKIYAEGSVLCIEDTGIGISSEDLPRIFENGYTGYNGRADKRASGIGLYLCKRICDNLGHKISAGSAPGVGTKISIDLSRREVGVE